MVAGEDTVSVSTTGGGLALAPGGGVAASAAAAAGRKPAGLERREPDEPTSTPSSIGRFRVLDELGRGGMGVVYAAYDEELDRKVAIKLIRWDAAYTAVARARDKATFPAREPSASVWPTSAIF